MISNEIYKDTVDEIDKLTRMLTSLCKYVDEWNTVPVSCLNGFIELELVDWWRERENSDKKKDEELKSQALSKLTKEEKRVLGL